MHLSAPNAWVHRFMQAFSPLAFFCFVVDSKDDGPGGRKELPRLP